MENKQNSKAENKPKNPCSLCPLNMSQIKNEADKSVTINITCKKNFCLIL